MSNSDRVYQELRSDDVQPTNKPTTQSSNPKRPAGNVKVHKPKQGQGTKLKNKTSSSSKRPNKKPKKPLTAAEKRRRRKRIMYGTAGVGLAAAGVGVVYVMDHNNYVTTDSQNSLGSSEQHKPRLKFGLSTDSEKKSSNKESGDSKKETKADTDSLNSLLADSKSDSKGKGSASRDNNKGISGIVDSLISGDATGGASGNALKKLIAAADKSTELAESLGTTPSEHGNSGDIKQVASGNENQANNAGSTVTSPVNNNTSGVVVKPTPNVDQGATTGGVTTQPNNPSTTTGGGTGTTEAGTGTTTPPVNNNTGGTTNGGGTSVPNQGGTGTGGTGTPSTNTGGGSTSQPSGNGGAGTVTPGGNTGGTSTGGGSQPATSGSNNTGGTTIGGGNSNQPATSDSGNAGSGSASGGSESNQPATSDSGNAGSGSASGGSESNQPATSDKIDELAAPAISTGVLKPTDTTDSLKVPIAENITLQISGSTSQPHELGPLSVGFASAGDYVMSGTVERTDGTKIKISRPVKVVENGSLVDPDTDTKVKQTIELKPVDVTNPKAGYSIFDDFDIISVSGAKVNGVAAPKIIFSDKTKTYQLNFKIGDTLFTREIRVHGTTDDNASATPTGETPANSSTDPNQNTTAPTTNPSDKSTTDESDGKTTTPETDETKATDDNLADPNLGAEISEVSAPLIKAYAVTDDHPTARVNMVTNLNAKLANTTMTPQDLDSLGVGLTTAGDYTFVATVTNSQGKPVTITQPVTILADGTAGAIETPTSQVTQTIRLQDFEVSDTKVGMPIFKTMDIKAANGTKVEGSSIPTIKFPARAATYELTYQVGATKFVQLVKVNPTQTV